MDVSSEWSTQHIHTKGLRMDNVPRVRVEDIESALSQIAEIRAARVVADSSGGIEEIHVLALPTKLPKQLVRDIESTLMAVYGVPVDHRKISIAQLGEDSLPEESPLGASLVRPRIVSLNATSSGLHASASVTLEIDGSEHVGSSRGPASQSGRLRQVALATLDALERYVSQEVAFALEDVTIVQLGRERVAVACVSLVTHVGEQHFTGSALVRQNDSDSVARATLGAVNRRFGLLTTE
jgi:hypothetical protein